MLLASPVSLKRTAYSYLKGGPGRPLIGVAASLVATGRGERTWISYDRQSATWLHRTSEGTTAMYEPLGTTARMCEVNTRDVFLRDHEISSGDVVLDVGAGIGTETLPFARMVGDRGRVVAVEAHPDTFTVLERVCELNQLHNVDLVQAAVMDTTEPVTMSDLPPELNYENKVGGEGVTVPARTLDDLILDFDLSRVDFLKMNIEGAELAALRGASGCLDRVGAAAIGCHDFLADETGDESYRTKDQVRALLLNAGFSVATRDDDPRPWAADYLFASR
jgi:FkbM family methyltransferase